MEETQSCPTPIIWFRNLKRIRRTRAVRHSQLAKRREDTSTPKLGRGSQSVCAHRTYGLRRLPQGVSLVDDLWLLEFLL